MVKQNKGIKRVVDKSILEIIKNYKEALPDELKVRNMYLFGSYAKGNSKESSDIDVAVVYEGNNDFFKAQSELRRLRRKIDLRIEPHPVRYDDFTQSNPFYSEILQHGIEI